MSAACPSIQSSHPLGNSNACRVSFGQVASQAETFSRSSSLPASFGKYDSFYLSLRNSGTDNRQQQQKQWMRRHQYRGDENVKGNLSSLRRRHERQKDTFNSMEMFSKDVYEDDFIEAERACVVGYGDAVRGMDMTSVESQLVTESHNDEAQQSIHDPPVSCEANQVSPLLSSLMMNGDPKPNISDCPDVVPKLNLQPGKHKPPPITHGLDDALMKLTLEVKHTVVTPCERLRTESQWEVMSEVDENTITSLSSIVQPDIHSQNSSISSCMTKQEEFDTQGQILPSETLDVSRPIPAKASRTQKSTPVKSPLQRHSISTHQLRLTPLSHAILSKGRFSTGSKSLALNSLTAKTTTVTPKRKPRGTAASSSKRRKTEAHGSTIVANAACARRTLYNGRAAERIRHVRKCTDEHCRWNPNLHTRKAACERCWTLASESERRSFIDNGGRHLRINLVKGGCPSSCKLFSHRTKVSASNGGGLFDDEDVRLCRKCFDDMHHVGVRQV